MNWERLLEFILMGCFNLMLIITVSGLEQSVEHSVLVVLLYMVCMNESLQ